MGPETGPKPQNTENKEIKKNIVDTSKDVITEAAKLKNPVFLEAVKEKFPTPESKTEKNMENIYKFSLENGISPDTLLAFFYTEKNITDKINKAIDKTASTTVIESQSSGVFEKGFEQVGKIESNPMTGAILDFTGSMKKEQIQAMVNTMLDLSKKGIIKEGTTFNIMYDISNQDGENRQGQTDAKEKNTLDKMKDTDQKTNAIEFGKDGAGLKGYLKEKGLINDNREVQKNGLGSTPLYTTILKNLMHNTVKDVTIFTDGASDVSANKDVGPEEIGNEDSWAAMINLCKNYDKKINIVAFNIKPEYLARTNAMQSYFKMQGAEKYINVIDLGPQNTATLSKTLTDKISNNYEIAIKEDQTNMINGKKVMTIDATKNTTQPNAFKMPDITNKDAKFVYDEKNAIYKGNLGEVFPNVDLSQYTVDYTINSSASIKQDTGEVYPGLMENNNTYILDISGSMHEKTSNLIKNERLGINPEISYAALMSMQESIQGFKSVGDKFDISKFGSGDSSKKLEEINFEKPDSKLYGLVLKAGKQYYTDILKKTEKNSGIESEEYKQQYKKYEPIIENIKNYLQKINDIVRKSAIAAINDKTVPGASSMYKNLLPIIAGKENDIKKLYGHITTLENIKGNDRTPLLQTISKLGDSAFSETYTGKNVVFFTDFGENKSNPDDPLVLLANKKIDNYKEEFDKNDFIQGLQKNLLAKGITIDFKYPENPSPNTRFKSFFELVGKYMNEESKGNPKGKKIFNFTRIPAGKGLGSILNKEKFIAQPSTYERNSITFKLTPKTEGKVLSETVAIDSKK